MQVTNYRNIYIKLINDRSPDKPDRSVIEAALPFVQQAQSQDTVILFLASHGISDVAGNYYFVPRDGIEEDLDRLEDGGTIETLMPWTTFFDTLRLTAGRRLLIVDTCQAANIEGKFESHSLMKRSASSRFFFMLASKGDEESQEYPAGRQGLFTYSLINAMSTQSDANKNGLLSPFEIFSGASRIVEKNRDKQIGPQTPQFIAPTFENGFELVRAAR